ncbi:AEC family transporter [Sporosarcina aquimarina]|uniref:AEC family transporter n=1 Tax=Sporosarcina aquimarina TaxID=114975 RepID=UPI001C8DABA4|nr:AEC family transporter [Sporosarcina aquimarina]MBY0221614.1 AEC family transporter [Sporosarcina aquimarina]
MDIGVVFQSIAMITILIVIGAVAARFYVFNDETKNMYITLITNVAMPSIILSSIFTVEIDRNMFKTLILIFVFSVLINLIGLLIGYVTASLSPKYSEKRIEVAILSAFGNTGFIGIPLCAVLFGAEGALYAAVFDAGVDFTIWTVGVYLMQNERKISWALLKNMINIPLIAIVLGIVVALTGVRIPSLFMNVTTSLAAFAIPLAMFYIGATFYNFQSSKVRVGYFVAAVPVLIKLIVLPLTIVVAIKFVRLDGLLMNVLIVQSTMPALTLSSVLFAKYSRDYKLGALVTIISTIAALFIIPVMLYCIDEYFLN